MQLLPLLEFHYSLVNSVPVKSLVKALGLPAGELRGPYRSMEGDALKSGLEIVKALGFVEKYNLL